MVTFLNTEKLLLSPMHKYIQNELYKKCSICEEWKVADTENYYKNKSNGIDGLHTWCKPCAIEKSKAKTPEEKQRKREVNLIRYYGKKEHLLIQMKEYRNNNLESWQNYYSDYIKREYVKENIKEYQNKRNQHKEHDISDTEWENCKEYFNNSCAYCGMNETDVIQIQGQKLHKEHALNNGANDITNCLPSCRSCNSKKWKRDFDEWYNELNKTYTDERFLKIINWLMEDCFKIKVTL